MRRRGPPPGARTRAQTPASPVRDGAHAQAHRAGTASLEPPRLRGPVFSTRPAHGPPRRTEMPCHAPSLLVTDCNWSWSRDTKNAAVPAPVPAAQRGDRRAWLRGRSHAAAISRTRSAAQHVACNVRASTCQQTPGMPPESAVSSDLCKPRELAVTRVPCPISHAGTKEESSGRVPAGCRRCPSPRACLCQVRRQRQDCAWHSRAKGRGHGQDGGRPGAQSLRQGVDSTTGRADCQRRQGMVKIGKGSRRRYTC